MKGVISIFAMPQELEDLALTLNMLKRNSVFRDRSINYKVDVTMCLSDELTDWENSKLPKEYIKERTIELVEKYLDWCLWDLQWDNPTILGCVSQRRTSLQRNTDADFFIWLDCDFIFKDTTLYYISSAFKLLKEGGINNFVITPQFVKQWDDTWDVVVNAQFLNKPIRYQETADIYNDTLPEYKDIAIQEIQTNKFAGGWFTCISGDLLRKTGIPESFGHYGLEDTYVIECMNIMKSNNDYISQFVVENLVIGESYTQRCNETIKKYIASKNRKDEFTKIAMNNFRNELTNFYERSYGSANGL